MRINRFSGALRGRIAKKKSGSRYGSIAGAIRKRSTKKKTVGRRRAATTSGTTAGRIIGARRGAATTNRNRRTAAGRPSWVAKRVSNARRKANANTGSGGRPITARAAMRRLSKKRGR